MRGAVAAAAGLVMIAALAVGSVQEADALCMTGAAGCHR